MTGKELIANLLQIISEADVEQEVYLKNGSEYTPIDSIKLDSDNGILVVVNEKLEFYCDICNSLFDKDSYCSNPKCCNYN